MRKLVFLLLVPLLAFTWSPGQRNTQTPVEQQTPGGALQPDPSLWVVNPFTNACVWDADDKMNMTGFGDLAPGESVENHECLLADWIIHLYNVQVYAQGRGSDQLVVEIGWSNPNAARSIVAIGEPGGRNSTGYDACFGTPSYDHDFPFLLVENSNGGVAQPTDIFVRITNTSNRLLRDVWVLSSLEPGFHTCPDGRYPIPDMTREEIIPSQMWWFF